MIIIFWSLLLIIAVMKGFEVAYVWRYISDGDFTNTECLKDKKFLISAIISLVIFALVAFIDKLSFETIIILDLVTVCVAVSLTDLKYKQIPNTLVILLMASQLIMLTYQNGIAGLVNVLWCAAVFIIVMLISWISKGQMGMGDVKLLSVICIPLGLTGLIWIFIVALSLSLIVGIYLMVFRKKSIKTELPFAPFITLSLLINLLINIL